MKKNRRIFGKGIFSLAMLFFYIPILYVVIFSFNSSKSLTRFSGFSMQWYSRMLENSEMMVALYTTIAVAVFATFISTAVGTISAIGLSKSKRTVRRLIGQINDLPIMNPEIVTAIGLMLLFITFKVEKGLLTMVIAHISFCIPYVILSVMPKIKSLDENLAEAAMDLGATPWQAITKVIVPQIKPGIVAGALIAFTMSVDDFIISYFVSGRGIKNLSIVVYTMSKRVNPSINAVSTLIVIIITIVLIAINAVPAIKRRIGRREGETGLFYRRENKLAKIIGAVSVLLIVSIAFTSLLLGSGGKYKGKTLHIYNWGEYTEPSLLTSFERETGAKVVMDTFDSNEQMYIKLANGESYDLVIPSDYMIERLIGENMLQKLDKEKIDFLDDIYHGVKNLSYDKNNEYSIPFFWGSVGIVYDKTKVDEKEVMEKGFSIFKDSKYRGETYLYDSERDSFMMALKDLGYSMNTKNQGELEKAYAWLQQAIDNTRPEIVTDEIIDNMAQGRKALAIMYSGDAAYAMRENENLGFVMPKSGTNLWSDAMVIPKSAKETELAHEFMKFMLRYENALKNSEFVGYTASNKEAFTELKDSEEAFAGIEAYVPRVGYEKDEIFKYDEETRKIIANMWSRIKIYAATKR